MLHVQSDSLINLQKLKHSACSVQTAWEIIILMLSKNSYIGVYNIRNINEILFCKNDDFSSSLHSACWMLYFCKFINESLLYGMNKITDLKASDNRMILRRISRKQNWHTKAGITAEWNATGSRDLSRNLIHICLKFRKCCKTTAVATVKQLRNYSCYQC